MESARFLVTGGSQGIGAAIVAQAREAGHQVVFTGRNQSLIDAVAKQTGAHGVRADVSAAAVAIARRGWLPYFFADWETDDSQGVPLSGPEEGRPRLEEPPGGRNAD